MDNNNDVFQLIYDGPALASHEMNVRDLAPALLALAQLLEDSNKALNGDSVKITVNLRATDEGSVDILLSVTQSLIDQAVSLFSGDGATAIVNAQELLSILGIGGSSTGVIGIIRWLKGRSVKKVTKLKDGNFQLEVEGDKEIRVVSHREIKLFGLLSVRKGFEAIVKKPLKSPGINKVKFEKDSAPTVEISDDEAEYFVAPDIEEEVLGESETTTSLQIVGITFQEGGKWRFSDGNATFYADILDEEFLNRVQQNEAAFAKDDILKVTLRTKQFLGGSGGIKTDYTIVKVLEHRSAVVQIRLPFVSGDE